MTLHRVFAVVALLVLASGCAQEQPPQESETSRELARLERELAENPPPARRASPNVPAARAALPSGVVPEVVDIPGQAASGAAATLSPQFVTAAQAAWKLIEEELPSGPASNDQAQFDSDLARTRAKLQEARRLAQSDDDKSVHLLLTLVLIKDKELLQTALLNRKLKVPEGNDPELADLSQQRKACAAEVRGWLFSAPEPARLRQAYCTTEARAVAAMAGVG